MDYKEDIGYTLLSSKLGGEMPDNTGVSVTQVEALSGMHGDRIRTIATLMGKTSMIDLRDIPPTFPDMPLVLVSFCTEMNLPWHRASRRSTSTYSKRCHPGCSRCHGLTG
ncbi:MAG: hypothetical protein V2J25_13280 [Desulfatiglans sp.]|nr:hypothetical protein [Desulfatiglans sp.]